MGLFSKIKDILFEDDGESEIPVYTKEDTVKKESVQELVKHPTPSVEVPSEPSEVRFKAPRAEMEYNDILDEVVKKEVEVPKPTIPPEVEKQPSSPFLSFDEEEFERLNSHIVVNERQSKAVPDIATARREEYSEFQRKANSNISATSTTKDNKHNPDRYKIDSSNGKKPFKPSPVISPVYGILDKNYKVDEIVDKKDGIKREVVKVPVREEITAYTTVKEDILEDDEVPNIDAVRNKAFGAMDELEKTATLTIEEKKEERKQVIEIPIIAEEESKDIVENLDLLEKDDDIIEEEEINTINNSLDDLVSEHFDNVLEETDDDEEVVMPRALDEVEKTTTLQILDDIEKELNSIKPEPKEESILDEEINKGDDSLEDDLFNLIDSMYEKGDDEDDD